MTRVTEILDYHTPPELLSWMLRTSKPKREASSQDSLAIGTIVDLLIQVDITKKEYFNADEVAILDLRDKYKIPVDNCMRAWDQFKKEHPEIVSNITEIQPELVYKDVMGHPDLVYSSKDRWGIIDVKTSKTVYPKYFTQTAEYADMYRWTKLLGPQEGIARPYFIAILRLDKESGKYFYQEVSDESLIEYEIGVFEAYKVAYEHSFKNREFLRQQLELEVLK